MSAVSGGITHGPGLSAARARGAGSVNSRINTGLTSVTTKNADSYVKMREKQLGSPLCVED